MRFIRIMREASKRRSIRRLEDPEHRASAFRIDRVSVQDRVQANPFPVAPFLHAFPLFDLFGGRVTGGQSSIQPVEGGTHLEIVRRLGTKTCDRRIVIHGDGFADDTDATVIRCGLGRTVTVASRKQQHRGGEECEMSA